MGGGPALEPGVGADVGQPQRLALAQHDAEHPVVAGQRADRRLLPGRDPVHHELGEGVVLVGHAERGVPGVGQGPRGPDDHLEHVPDAELTGYGLHDSTHSLKYLVPALSVELRAGLPRLRVHAPDGTGGGRGRHRTRVLGPWT